VKHYLIVLILAYLALVAGCADEEATSTDLIHMLEAITTTTAPTVTSTTAHSTTMETIPFPVGEATLADPEGDVASPDGKKPSADKGDLVSVLMVVANDELVVRFVNSAPLPTESGTSPLGGDEHILWYIQTTVADGSWQYQLGVSLIGYDWTASICDFKAAPGAPSNVYVDTPIISGNEIIAVYPLWRVVDLFEATHWWAGTEWSQGWTRYEDTVPDDGADAPVELLWRD